MCDDYFDSWDDFEDTLYDPNNDYEEDIAGEWWEDESYINEQTTAPTTTNIKNDSFDLMDAILFGALSGAVYASVVDENRQMKRVKSEEVKKK